MTLKDRMVKCHERSKEAGFWEDYYNNTEKDPREAFAIKLLLVITEIAEMVEELRKNPLDKEKLGEELADTYIRLFDLSEVMENVYGFNLDEAIANKMIFNKTRGHKHGKAF